ncbi:F0F1 ATP synthase subunit delta [Oricola nitratireducens]|uniref:F0F1 ATP synthase subunit delta n=1 Tax=Oricola nitratireducens TaxID=2775868 RepID=UPI0018678A2E|nr:F0F1 ATP synthase subunit delta [Oricola nitratireducens]
MEFDWWTFFFEVVNIGVLLWLLARFLFRPVARIIDERKAETARVLEDAGKARKAADEAEAEARAERDRIHAERVDLLENARAEAEAQKKDLLMKARRQADEVVGKVRAAAEQAAEEEREQRIRRASELSVAITRRLMDSLPADARIDGYAERLVEALAALGADERAAVLAAGEDLRLVAPRELSKAELAAVTKKIASAVPHDGQLPVEVDPSLIAGLELRSRHGVVHNSLAADLGRVAEALASDEQA